MTACAHLCLLCRSMLLALMDVMSAAYPWSTTDWQEVFDRAVKADPSLRIFDGKKAKKKFRALVNSKPPTGNKAMPQYIARAKQLHYDAENSSGARTLEGGHPEEDDDDDDGGSSSENDDVDEDESARASVTVCRFLCCSVLICAHLCSSVLVCDLLCFLCSARSHRPHRCSMSRRRTHPPRARTPPRRPRPSSPSVAGLPRWCWPSTRPRRARCRGRSAAGCRRMPAITSTSCRCRWSRRGRNDVIAESARTATANDASRRSGRNDAIAESATSDAKRKSASAESARNDAKRREREFRRMQMQQQTLLIAAMLKQHAPTAAAPAAAAAAAADQAGQCATVTGALGTDDHRRAQMITERHRKSQTVTDPHQQLMSHLHGVCV